MDERLLHRVLDERGDLAHRALTRSIGLVADVDPFTVTIGGVNLTEALPAINYTPVLGDRVWVSRSGRDLVVHGVPRIGPPPISRTAATAALILTTTPTNVTGVTYTIPEDGRYKVFATFYFVPTVAGYVLASGYVAVNGTTEAEGVAFGSGTGWAMGSQTYLLDLVEGDVVTLKGAKLIAAGTIALGTPHTTMLVEKVS